MRHLGEKLLHLLLVLLAVTAVTFFMLDLLPVSIAHEIAGRGATAHDLASIRHQLRLDDPVLLRYGRWLTGIMRGDFGNSLSSGQPVAAAIAAQFPVTFELLILAQLFAIGLAVPAGILCAWRSDSWMDRLLATLGFAVTSVPNFVLAIVLVLLCSIWLKWFPATGYTALSEGLWPNLHGMILPAASIALVESVMLMRVLRSDLMATLQEDFILLARAKGLPTWSILLRHALRPSCLTLITLVGLHVGNLISAAVIIENIFALPGLGRLLLSSILSQDFPAVQGCVIVMVTGYVVVNHLVDLCYALLDPRIRKGGSFG
jgi:peptide/nickel transport system permease protein